MKQLIIIFLVSGLTYSTDMNVWISDVTNSSVEVSVSSTNGFVEISGFQLDIITEPLSDNLLELVDTLFIEGDTVSIPISYPISGLVTDSNYTCFASSSSKVVSFSFDGSQIVFDNPVVLAKFVWDTSDCLISSVTVGDPVFISTVGSVVTELSVDVGEPFVLDNTFSEVTSSFSLESNYPNPFNPITTIEYSIAKPGLVDITIYDIAGVKVISLVSGYKHSGSYSVNWYGQNITGDQVSSGVYFYRIFTDGFTATEKMLFLK